MSQGKKYGRSKTRLRAEVAATKGRNADLWEEVQRLRALATAVREWVASGDVGPLYAAADKALLWETGPGVATRLAEDRSTRVSIPTPVTAAPVRGKDALTERYYQEDQAVLRRDGWEPFLPGDPVEPT